MQDNPGQAQGGHLTVKQEAFCQSYLETGNASEAYRRAYDAENMKPEGIWVNASKLLSSTNVALRVAELQMEASERHNVTLDSLTIELETAREKAMSDPKGASAAVTATMGKAKLHGFLADKVIATVSGPDGRPLDTGTAMAKLAELVARHRQAEADAEQFTAEIMKGAPPQQLEQKQPAVCNPSPSNGMNGSHNPNS